MWVAVLMSRGKMRPFRLFFGSVYAGFMIIVHASWILIPVTDECSNNQ